MMGRWVGRLCFRLGRIALALGLRGADREFLRGDLEEEALRRRGDRPGSAGRWYLWQALRTVLGRGAPDALHHRLVRARWNRDRIGDGRVLGVVQDVRFSVRILRQQPAFTAGALLTLALGIGAVTTMFTFVNALMLRPMPFPQPDRLVMLERVTRSGGTGRVDYLDYRDWAERSDSFLATAAHYDNSFNLAAEAEPIRVSGLVATGELFAVLGVEAVLGRTFGPADDDPSQPPVVVLGHGLWERSFDSDPAIVGSEIRLHGRPYTVIGVMPPGFAYPQYEDLWTPARVDPVEMTRGNNYWQVVARLRGGASLAGARQEMSAIGAQLAEEHPELNAGTGATATDFRDSWVGDSDVAVLVFLGAVIFVQMIATVNVGNLLLARASARRKEVAVRSAIGASRLRLLRQLLTESLLLAGAGGAAGLALGRVGSNLILASIPIELPRWFDFSFDLRVALFVAALTVATGIVFGLVPALYASRDLNDALKHGGEGAGSRRRRLRSGLVVAEVALALVLLVGAGLMLKAMTRVRSVEPGIDPEGVLSVRLALPQSGYGEPDQRRVFTESLLERAGALPGVVSVGTVAWLPFSNSGSVTSVSPEGMVLGDDDQPPSAVYNVVGGGYFETMGVPIVRGRGFERGDAGQDRPLVAVVSQSTADRLWPEGEAVGRRFRFGRPEDTDNPLMTVVGIAGDVRFWGLDRPVALSVYFPNELSPRYAQTLVLKVEGDPLALVPAIREQVRDLDSELPLYEIRTMEGVLAASLWDLVIYSRMFAVFAGLALALAAVGLYGVIAFAVGRRTREIGIRMALGAEGSDVLRLVVRQALGLVAIGVAAGLVGSFLLSGVLASLLYGVSARDPLVYLSVAAMLTVVAGAATVLPGRRATRVDPMIALGSD